MSQNPLGGKPRPGQPIQVRSAARPAAPTPIPPIQPLGGFELDEKTDPGIVVSSPAAKTAPIRNDFIKEDKTDPGIVVSDFSTPEKTDPGINVSPVIANESEFQVDDQIPELSADAFVAETESKSKATRKMPEMGALSDLMKDPTITEIMVNDSFNVMVERKGRIEPAVPGGGKVFEGEDEIQRIIRNILAATGKYLSAEQPYVDATLPDGSRVNIVIAPVAIDGPSITIRKFPDKRLSIKDLLVIDALDQKMAYFLKACVSARLNILISGGTGSGKTTLLNVMTQFVPEHERIVLIEDTSEVLLMRPNRVRLQTKPQTPSSPKISARELVANALRMRPDRIIMGECRSEEAFDMLQAMNTGHSGSMTTVHANTPRDALARIESLCMMAGMEIPLAAMRRQLVSAIDLIIQIQRFRNGERKVVSITELSGLEGEVITLQDIFVFQWPSTSLQPAEDGSFRCTGFVPQFVDRLQESGTAFPPDFFM